MKIIDFFRKNTEKCYAYFIDIKEKYKIGDPYWHLLIWALFFEYIYYFLSNTESAIYRFRIHISLQNQTLAIASLILTIFVMYISLIKIIPNIKRIILKRVILFFQFIVMVLLTSMITIFWADYVVIEQKALLIFLNLILGFLFFLYFEHLKQMDVFGDDI